jgi:3-deoxy-D-manno-octulosonic-acid transferase
VLLVDGVGELMSFYALSDLVFVGGSLVPTGGHNILEPASLGIPVLFGPYMNNFREITALVLEAEAGIQVRDGGELLPVVKGLLDDADRRSALGDNGLRLMERLGGSTARHMDVIDRVLRKVKSEE